MSFVFIRDILIASQYALEVVWVKCAGFWDWQSLKEKDLKDISIFPPLEGTVEEMWVSESWRAPRLCPTWISCHNNLPSKKWPCTSWARVSATRRFVWVFPKLRKETSPVFLMMFPFSLEWARSLHTTPFQASPTVPEEKSLKVFSLIQT